MLNLRFERNNKGFYIIRNKDINNYHVSVNTFNRCHWLTDKITGQRILAKEGFGQDYITSLYGEMLFSKFAENNNIKCAKVDVGVDSRDNVFVFSKDVVDLANERLDLGQVVSYCDVDVDSIANLSSVYALDYLVRSAFENLKGLEVDKNFKKELLKVALIDFLTVQEDRNYSNLLFEISRGNKGYKLSLCPMYDNEKVFSFEEASLFIDLDYFDIEDMDKDFDYMFEFFAQKNLPKLGIKTDIDNLRTAYTKSDEAKLLLNIFVKELAEELILDKQLMEFYKTVKFDALKYAREIKSETKFRIPDGYLVLAQHQFKERKKMLDKALKLLQQKEKGEE